jgi:hypothetical protein
MPAPYPALIGERLAYDRMTTGFSFVMEADENIVNYQTPNLTAMKDLNNEDTDIAWSVTSANDTDTIFIGIVFPELYDVEGYYAVNEIGAWVALQKSTNTTDGTDGTWDTVISEEELVGCFQTFDVADKWRTDAALLPTPAVGVRGIRFSVEGGGTEKFHAIHWYGHPSAAATVDRLKFWNSVLDTPSVPNLFEFDDGCPRRSSEDKLFRIKNTSVDKVAFAVSLAVDSLTPPLTGPQLHQTLLLSEDGGLTFSAAIVIGTLAPGQVSPTLILRRVTPNACVVGTWTSRVFVSASGGFKDDEQYVYFEDVSTDVPTPHLWFLYPPSGYRGDVVQLYGLGFGDNQPEYDGTVKYGTTDFTPVSWSKVNGTGAQFGTGRAIQSANANVNVEHQRIAVTMPIDADDNYFTVETDA